MTGPTHGKFSADDLAAIEEIKQLKAAYAYCVDNKDWKRWASLFTTDARVDESESGVARDPFTGERVPVPGFSLEYLDQLFAFDWPLVGREAIQSFGETIAVNNRTVHHLFVPEIERTSSTSAKAIWPMEDYAWWPEGSPVRFMHGMGYYHETYERLDDQRWYIKTIDFARSWIEWR
ncbi:nuclear transport factor 2 family protein [Trujillonella endophytica]|uniref:SnoaL-like domain-containing protein n=1 Tax=Trujillonella endophytica TaxID=673521 RepID=A0A1H8QSH5_9ACTN|nr:nuclear transport factor 2 family protein [Trujillella endophytica]SEO57249.1 SnoaL-like domain-containing protein [Trujillella endophytica]